MTAWYLSEQARDAVRGAVELAREHRHWWLGPDHLLAAILRRWDDEDLGGVALLRACGLTDARELLERGRAARGAATRRALGDRRAPGTSGLEPRAILERLLGR